MNMTHFTAWVWFPTIKDTELCVWSACSIRVTCHMICPLPPGKRLRGFQAKTSRLSNSFLPAGCHTAQQLLLKLSELIILQKPPSCTYAACDSIFKLPLHCAFQVCARDCLSTSKLLLFINTVFAFSAFLYTRIFLLGHFMVHITAFFVSYCGYSKIGANGCSLSNESFLVGFFFFKQSNF